VNRGSAGERRTERVYLGHEGNDRSGLDARDDVEEIDNQGNDGRAAKEEEGLPDIEGALLGFGRQVKPARELSEMDIEMRQRKGEMKETDSWPRVACRPVGAKMFQTTLA